MSTSTSTNTQDKAVRPPKGFYLTTTLIGLGFFTMGLMDPLYDAYVPRFLNDFLDSFFFIGAIMTFDNVFALLLIPIVAAWSDRVRTPIGRRMPFILVTLPASAIFFALIPFGALPAGSLFLLVFFIFMLNVFKQAARGPVVALMPDVTPGAYRSEANGVINMMGGLAAIVGTVGLARLADIDIILPIIGSTARRLPFMLAGLLVVLATIALFVFVKEPRAVARAAAAAKGRPSEGPDEPDASDATGAAAEAAEAASGHGDAATEAIEEERPRGLIASARKIFGVDAEGDTNARNILFALFFWFLGYQGMLPFVTTYSVDILGTTEGLAGLTPGAVAIGYTLFAIPSGILGHRIGRKTVIRGCLIGLAVILGLVFLHYPVSQLLGLGQMAAWISFLVLLLVFGICWGSVVTNSFPMLWQSAGYADMGIYTGSYYLFSQSAAIIAPLLAGGVIDATAGFFGYAAGLRSIFVFATLCMVVALFFMGRLTREQ